LAEEMGPQVPMKPSWLSVLGNTTRDTHAILDGTPADGEGLFNVGGYRVPWPAHYSLPPGERCNCQCTLTTEFGMDEEEARGLIAEHEERLQGLQEPVGTPPSVIPELPPEPKVEPVVEEPVFDEAIYRKLQREWESSMHVVRGDPKYDDQRVALHGYTSEWYKPIRDCQNRNKGCTEQIRELMKDVQAATDRAPKYQGTVYRGMVFKTDEDLAEFVARAQKSGLEDKGFLSTSKKESVARKFAKGYSGEVKGPGVVMEIRSKSGVSIEKFSSHESEREVLLGPGAKLRVVEMTKKKGMVLLRLEEI